MQYSITSISLRQEWERMHLGHPFTSKLCFFPQLDGRLCVCVVLGRRREPSALIWKVKEESASIVIKPEMNDGFRGCGVERLDERGAEGPFQFPKCSWLWGGSCHASALGPPHCASLDTYGRDSFIGAYELYLNVREWNNNPPFNLQLTGTGETA